jgi:hypothetical protein
MFAKLFEDRDKKISYLIKLGDCMGRSLRENVTLFSIDSQNSLVTYLTESDKVISGQYKIGKDVVLNNIDVRDSSIFEDNEVFDSYVTEKLHTFVENIHYNEYGSADNSFTDILSLWENRVKLDSVQSKLHEKTQKLNSIGTIVESAAFQQLVEITPQFIEFLKENKEKVGSVPEIRNAVNLSNTVSTAFNFPRLSYQDLLDNKSYILKDGINESIYEMICKQELVKKELIESKKEFELIWASNSSVRKLASMVFEESEVVVQALSEAVREVPYIALASKKTLFETFNNCLAQADGIGVSGKDIQRFASDIFEMKKEVKQLFIESINEKYGINVLNLQEPVSFRSLLNTQVVIFEALSRLSPKETILKQVLSEMAQSLRGKSGVEGIDVNEYLKEVFSIAGYEQILERSAATKEKPSLKQIGQNVKTKGKFFPQDDEYTSDENVDQDALEAEEEGEGKAGEAKAAAKAKDKNLEKAAKIEGAEAEEEKEAPAEEGTPPEEETEEGEPVPKTKEAVPEKEVVDDLGGLEKMIADIAAELNTMDNKEEK